MYFVPFTSEDIAALLQFQPPGWGDLVPRFRYFIESSFCNPVKLMHENRIIAIGTSIAHKDSAWLACIIVHPDHRNRGYGKAITEKLIEDIDRDIFTTISLDATDMGYPVYINLGFIPDAVYAHFKGESIIQPGPASPHIIPYDRKYLEQLLALDKKASGEDRNNIIRENLSTALLYCSNEIIEGFYLPSLGEGLIIAANPLAGIELMKRRLQNNTVAILPLENHEAMDFLQQNGFAQYRISRRLYLGEKRNWSAYSLFNRINGQLG